MSGFTIGDRVWLSVLIGLLVAMIAHELGVVWWRDWEPGDAADFGTVSGLIALKLSRIWGTPK